MPETVFIGSGELAGLMREADWRETAVGVPDLWPQSVRAIIRMMLTSRYAMWMGWGPDLTFFYNDAYACMTLGAKHPWALGRPAREVWSEIWPDIGPRIAHVLATGEATWDEGLLLFLERSGFQEETYHTFSYSPLHQDDGEIAGMFCVVTEETERVIGERRLRLLRTLGAALAASKTTDDVWQALENVLRTDGRDLPFAMAYVFGANDGTAMLAARCNVTDGELIAPPAIAIDDDSLWPLQSLMGEGGAPSRIIDLPADLPRPAGPWQKPPARAILMPLAQPGQLRPAGVFVAGLNPHCAFDAEFASFISLLVGQLASGLANAQAYVNERLRAEALAQIDRAKTRFFSNVSHELRTPLSLILGPVADAVADERHALTGGALDLVDCNARRLHKLVNALLDFSRLESGRVEPNFEPTDLASYTTEVASSFRSVVESAGVRFVVEAEPDGPATYIDRDMWEKIVLNLVSNAFKFTLDGQIRVAVARVGSAMRLQVSDTGIGIPASELPRVFERFHRVEGAVGRTHEGTGIGLALVQELVKTHGGIIDVESGPDRGTTFTIWIPLGSSHLPPARVKAPRAIAASVDSARAFIEETERWSVPDAPLAPPESDQAPRVLVADDNADMRAYLQSLLGHLRVDLAADGLEALRIALERPPDVVVTDVMMPRLDGFGLLKALRGDDRTRTIPVLMLSARACDESRVEGLEAGADDYLPKPFTAREVVAKVDAQIARARGRAAAELANQTKDEFLAMLGHELRNPLAPILTALQLLRLRGVEGGERERTIIERQVRHLVGLVNDLLDISRITRGKIRISPELVELNEIVAKAIELASPLLEQQRHRLETHVPRKGLTVMADPARLAQVVSNLLTNAAKFTPPGGVITISARVEGREAVLAVRDNGIGIGPEMLPRIFELFTQERQAIDRAPGGLGLGLAIVRSLVALHGGSVAAHSDGASSGSEFVIRLPRMATAKAPARPPQQTSGTSPGSGRRVLVVDDNEDATETLADTLEAWGYAVATAHDGPTALATALQFGPEVALLDLGLPVMDGFELARRFRAAPELRKTRLVAVTGYGQEHDRRRSAAAGFDAHIVKPMDIDELKRIVEQVPDSAKGA